MRLTDPWFAAEFYGLVEPGTERTGCCDQPAPHWHGGSFTMQADRIEGAQGLWLWCPCGYGKPEFMPPNEGRPHCIMTPFANPRNAPACPSDHGPQSARDQNGPRPRWQLVSGSGLHDLTLAPSVAVGSAPECWHGWIQNGEAR